MNSLPIIIMFNIFEYKIKLNKNLFLNLKDFKIKLEALEKIASFIIKIIKFTDT